MAWGHSQCHMRCFYRALPKLWLASLEQNLTLQLLSRYWLLPPVRSPQVQRKWKHSSLRSRQWWGRRERAKGAFNLSCIGFHGLCWEMIDNPDLRWSSTSWIPITNVSANHCCHSSLCQQQECNCCLPTMSEQSGLLTFALACVVLRLYLENMMLGGFIDIEPKEIIRQGTKYIDRNIR